MGFCIIDLLFAILEVANDVINFDWFWKHDLLENTRLFNLIQKSEAMKNVPIAKLILPLIPWELQSTLVGLNDRPQVWLWAASRSIQTSSNIRLTYHQSSMHIDKPQIVLYTPHRMHKYNYRRRIMTGWFTIWRTWDNETDHSTAEADAVVWGAYILNCTKMMASSAIVPSEPMSQGRLVMM